ncbi:MAG: aromatic ring-hydroxylating dioxygenase subunit alpha [Rhodanobacteraceae bacterium]
MAAEVAAPTAWPAGQLTRVPYWVFQRADVYAREQQRLFRGDSWNYLCTEAELPRPGDYVATQAGDTPVIAVRAEDGQIYAFENRCAHRGAVLAFKDCGHVKNFTCVYHAWSYNLHGDLTGIAFKDGVNGKGGMSPTFDMGAHGLRKLRVTTLFGLVFGSFSEEVPPFDEYLGEDVFDCAERILKGHDIEVIGRFTQMLPYNWKLYFENVKDSYHASILHAFFTTFRLNRLSQRGEVLVSENGGNHVSYSAIDSSAKKDVDYAAQDLRSNTDYALADPTLLDGFDERGDGVTLQILSIFPGFVLQQIRNSIALRQIVPQGPGRTRLNWTYVGFKEDTPEQRQIRLKQGNLVGPGGYVSMEDGCVGELVQRGIAGAPDQGSVVEMGGTSATSSESRVTEASIRGFWKAYRREMAL